MPQRLGEYRHRCIIQKRTETQDEAGQPIRSWSQHAVRWAKESRFRGSEGFQPDAIRAELAAEFRLQQTYGVEPKMRLLKPGPVTTLAGAISSATTTTLTVADADGFPLVANYRARLASEIVEVTGGQGTTSWTVTRGLDGTTAATAYATGQPVQYLEPYDIHAAHNDWAFGAETVLVAERSDSGS